ncbi:hypothetical protein CsatB_000703 [Cannabis sativa]
MTTTRSGSKSPSPVKKNSKNLKKPPTNSSKVDPKMGLKRIAKKVMGDVPEPSGTKKRPIPDKVESHKVKRAKPSKSTKDVISDSDFENEVHDGGEKPKVKSKVCSLEVVAGLFSGCCKSACAELLSYDAIIILLHTIVWLGGAVLLILFTHNGVALEFFHHYSH